MGVKPNLLVAVTIAMAIFPIADLMMSEASGIVVPLSARAGDVPTSDGDGLIGQFYDAASGGTNAGADSVIANNSPTATWTSTLADYPNGEINSTTSVGLSAWLGTDASSLVGSGTMQHAVMRLVGFFRVIQALDSTGANSTIDVEFGLGAEGGALLRIGGVDIVDAGGTHPFPATALAGRASFLEEGLYPIEVIYYREAGPSAGVELYSNDFWQRLDSNRPPTTNGIPVTRAF